MGDMKGDNAPGIRPEFLLGVGGRHVAGNTKHLARRFLTVHMVDEKGMIGILAGAAGNVAAGMEIVEREAAGRVEVEIDWVYVEMMGVGVGNREHEAVTLVDSESEDFAMSYGFQDYGV